MTNSNGGEEKEVKDPTYMAQIRLFFDPIDIEHMDKLGIDLAHYDGVKSHALTIYFQTQPPNGPMPAMIKNGQVVKDPKRGWSQARSDTFKNWIANGYPRGVAEPVAAPVLAKKATRVRKDLSELSTAELALLVKAFKGLMKRSADKEDSYFALAGIHWLPTIPDLYCLHHVVQYNPWHRLYLTKFEDALRTVNGCEKVTLPYWDITRPLPAALSKRPFNTYKLPRDIGSGYNKGYVTERFSAKEIEQNVKNYGIPDLIKTAMGKSHYEAFNSSIWQPHDAGHGSCGPTMADQNVAAFDPIFWFFHANWDRLWWKWQQAVGATTLPGFLTTLTGSADWLKPPFNVLAPFTKTADQSIDLGNIGYAHPEKEAPADLADAGHGSVVGARMFRIQSEKQVSIRVKGIDRLKIPGTFVVHLRADGQTIARKVFFQSMTPEICGNCREHGTINMDFIQDFKAVSDCELGVGIELLRGDRIGDWFPLGSCGSPTVNMRFLLEQQ